MRLKLFAAVACAAVAGGLFLADYTPPAAAQARYNTEAASVEVTRLVSGLDIPWAVAPLPEGGALITERDGRLLHFDAQWRRKTVAGVPEVAASGQGGLLDITLAADFATTGTLFLTYSEPAGRGARTAMAAARLSEDRSSLEDVTVLFQQEPALRGGRHFGSRVVEAADGTLFVTTGDRGDRPLAQDPQGHVGKVVRIARDGSVPEDNPFADGESALPEIWSIGHRNIQGATLDEEGRLWTLSHGARGGDEVNLAEAGKNYGWPVISYGRHYSGLSIGEGTAQEGMEQPKFYWDPSIAPSGMVAYTGDAIPAWRGDLFVGALKFDYIARLERDGDRILGEEKLFEDIYPRIRDVVMGPDGTLWFLSEGEGALYSVSAAGSG
ncbi:MAG: PQQ-dependent sugar dehydrogenase [Pseudomonadota bacterium]